MPLWENTYFVLFHLSAFQSSLSIRGRLGRLFFHHHCFISALAMLSHPIDFGLGQDLLWSMEHEWMTWTPHLTEEKLSVCSHDLVLLPLSDAQGGS